MIALITDGTRFRNRVESQGFHAGFRLPLRRKTAESKGYRSGSPAPVVLSRSSIRASEAGRTR